MAHSIYILLDGTMPKASSLTESIKSRLNWLRDELRRSANEYRLAVFSYGAINFNTVLPLSNVKEATAPLPFQPQVGFRSLGSALGKVAHIVAKDRRNYPDDTRLLYVVSHGVPLPKLKKPELDEKLLPCGFSKKTVVLLGDIPDSAPGEYLPLTPNIYQNQPDELFNNVLSDVGAAIRRPAPPILGSTIGRKSAVTSKGKAKADSAECPASPSIPPPLIPTIKPKRVKTPPPLPSAVTADAQRRASDLRTAPPAVSTAETRLLRTQNLALMEKVRDLESRLSAQASTTVSLNGLTARNNELERQLSNAQAKLAELEKSRSASEQNSQTLQKTEARLAEQEKTLSATKRKLSAALSENEKLKQQIQEQTVQQKEQVSLLSSQADEQRNGLTARNNELERQLSSAQAKLAELEKSLSASEQNSQALQRTEASLAEQEKALSATRQKLSAVLSENEKLKQQIQEQTARQKERVSLLSSQADEQRAAQEQKIAELQTAKQTLEQKVLGQATLQTELEMTRQMWAQTQEFNKSLQGQVEGLKRIVDRQKQELAKCETSHAQAISGNQLELDRLQQENSVLRQKYADLEKECRPYLQLLTQRRDADARRQRRKEEEERQKANKRKEELNDVFGSDDFPSDPG